MPQRIRRVHGPFRVFAGAYGPAQANHDGVHALYRLILGRNANDRELVLADEFLTAFAAQASTSPQVGESLGPWEAYAQALLLSNQFVFVD